jgi:hypothetical protein
LAEFPKNLAKALFAIQGELEGVVKDSTNPHFKNKYASLEAVIETIKPVLQAHGLVFMQSPGAVDNGALSMTTTLIHADSGECMHSTMQLPLAKSDPQGAGSAITYACRYSLMALFGIPPVDDDAESASAPGNVVKLSKLASNENYKKLQREIDEARSVEQLKLWAKGPARTIKNTMPAEFQFELSARYEDKMADLKQMEQV